MSNPNSPWFLVGDSTSKKICNSISLPSFVVSLPHCLPVTGWKATSSKLVLFQYFRYDNACCNFVLICLNIKAPKTFVSSCRVKIFPLMTKRLPFLCALASQSLSEIWTLCHKNEKYISSPYESFPMKNWRWSALVSVVGLVGRLGNANALCPDDRTTPAYSFIHV